MSQFPFRRMRRLRKTPLLRQLVAETVLRPSQLIQPLFIVDRSAPRTPVSAMPGIDQVTVDEACRDIEKSLNAGVSSFLLFGVPDAKDAEATEAWSEEGIIQQALARLKAQFDDDIVLVADTCLCEYTSHGHCGVLMDGTVLNDPSLELLAKTAVAQAEAGADVIAPSSMMDGCVAVLRQVLDDEGYQDTPIMGYSAKFASAFYGPFREAAESAPQKGDRKSYQMDYRNGREALTEAMLDQHEAADILMVKPALAYLDVIRDVREACDIPLAAYSVSGEYSMIKAAAQQGWLNERDTVLETHTAMARAGADMIITYFATDLARWLNE